jgi:hypothetical protein
VATAQLHACETVIDGIAALDDPRHLAGHVQWLARRENYSEAVVGIETRLNRRARFSERVCVENILGTAPLSTRIFRVARSFDLFEDLPDGRAIPALNPAEYAASAPDKAEKRMVVAVLGYVASAAGTVPIEETTRNAPGFWPSEKEERIRLALALCLIVRLRHGVRLRWHLVRP